MKGGLSLLALALIATAGPHKVVRKTAALDFKYEWPSEAVAIPALDLHFYTEAKHDLTEAQDLAREDKKYYLQEGRETALDLYLQKWTTAGQSSRLLSLRSDYEVYTGGAHPNYNTSDLLWDRQLNRGRDFGNLFMATSGYAPILRSEYCHKLYDARTKRNGERTGEVFEMCPKFSDLAIIPTDHDRNGRFDEILVVASPYTAGSFAEGEYDIALPVTPQLVAAMKPEYRNSFETQRH
jgi:hypothetical protein